MSKSPKSGFDPMNNPFMDPKTNPFLDPEKNPFLKGDFAKMFQGFEAPNMSGITDSQRKNMEALTVANKTAAEGVQAANAALQELQSKGVSTPDTAASIDQVKNTIENSITNMRELSEMMAKSQAEAFDIVNKRFVESMDELKATMSKISK